MYSQPGIFIHIYQSCCQHSSTCYMQNPLLTTWTVPASSGLAITHTPCTSLYSIEKKTNAYIYLAHLCNT